MRFPSPILAGLLLAVPLAGCSSGPAPPTLPPVTSTPSADPTPSSAAVASPTPVPTSGIVRPKDQKTPDGASAFVRYFYAVYNEATAKRESGILRSLSDPTCKTCALYANYVEVLAQEGSELVGGRVSVVNAVAPGGDSDMPSVSVQLSIAEGHVRKADGSDEFIEAAERVDDVQLTWTGASWSVFRVFS